MLKKLETFTLLLAALLALAVEGAFVYWMHLNPRGIQGLAPSLFVGDWMSPTLPQYWLIGALLALFYYLTLVLRSRTELKPDNLFRQRQTFLRIWYWFLAAAGAQGCALYLDYFAVLHR